jgi:hypothetical protein
MLPVPETELPVLKFIVMLLLKIASFVKLTAPVLVKTEEFANVPELS